MLAGFIAGAILSVASVAFACILRMGNLLVCSPPSKTYVSNTQCSKAVGTGGQSGLARFEPGDALSVKARKMRDMPYRVLFRMPGSSAGCATRAETLNPASHRSLIGEDSDGRPNTVMGPKFFRKKLSAPADAGTGSAQVCVTDPGTVTAQTVSVAVI